MDSQWSCYCFLEVFGSAWGAPVPKRAQRASEASARSDSVHAILSSVVESCESLLLYRNVVNPSESLELLANYGISDFILQ